MNQRARPAQEAPQPGFVTVGGRRLRHLIARGTEDAVVRVHGFGGSLDHWGENYAALAATGPAVTTANVPGALQSLTAQ